MEAPTRSKIGRSKSFDPSSSLQTILESERQLIEAISNLLAEFGPLNVKHIITHAKGERCARGHRQYCHVLNRTTLNVLNESFGGFKVIFF